MFRLICAASLGLLVIGIANSAVANDRECRRFTEEIRVGGNNVDSYGTICKAPDGTWREVESDEGGYEKGGYFIRPDDSRYYEPDTHIHHFNDRYDTRVIIGDSRQPYVVVDPYYYGRRSHYDRHWNPAKRAFHRHHHGPGWEKHWKHHERTLNGK